MMKKNFRTLILALLLQVFTGQQVLADTSQNSCVAGINLFNVLLAEVTTLGLFSVYSNNFTMTGAPSGPECDKDYYGGRRHDPNGCAAGDSGCSSDCNSKGGVEICYKTLIYTGITQSNPTGLTYQFSCQEAQDGWSKTYTFPPATIRVKKIGDQLCAQFWTILGFQSMGCKYLPDCSRFSLNSSCYVAQACSNSAYQQSRSFVPIAGGIIQCVKESIQRLFNDYTGCGNSSNYKQNYFPVFQSTMRNVVSALLLLYVIFFGIKLALGGEEAANKGAFFNFGLKFILVLYFSVGLSAGYNNNGQAQYKDGITQFALPFFQNGSASLASIVYSAGGATGLCTYKTQDYPAGYEYLALWDSIDCRLLYYMGIDQKKIATGAVTGVAVTVFMFVGTMYLLPLAAIFGFQFIFGIFCLVFMIFLLSIVIYFVNITVISMIALAILLYMAPIFVPMALFEPSKKYFEGWLKLVISYALQPMVIAAYIAMMLTIFDQTMFGNCTFTTSNITFADTSRGQVGSAPTKMKPFFQICNPDAPQAGCTTAVTDANATNCKDTLGYKLTNQDGNLVSGKLLKTVNAIFFSYTSISPGQAEGMLSSLITLCLFAYLFYKFADMLGEFTAELTGGTNLGSLAGRPMELFDQAMAYATTKKPKEGEGKGSPSDAKVSTAKRPGGGGGSI